jgi:hypothetical protein
VSGTHAGIDAPSGISSGSWSGNGAESPSPDWDSADPVRRIRNREEDERSRTSGVSSGITKAIKRICRQIVADPQPLTMSAILVLEERSDLEILFDSSLIIG